MNTPDSPRPADAAPSGNPLDQRLATWCELEQELSELHARLEYFRLMLKLSDRRAAGG